MRAFEERLIAAWPPTAWSDVGVLVAVSGGADSVALLRALIAIRDNNGEGRLLVAHFNHRLRGSESDVDAAFVADLCRQLQVPCVVGRADENLEQHSGGLGLEAAARNARHLFLQTTAEQHGARFVVTAHTANDQVETVLQRMLRGTSLTGLAGIPRTRPLGPATTLLRPLLIMRRSDVLQYLQELPQDFREDSSNQDTDLLRNRIRHQLLPLLVGEYHSAAFENLLHLAETAAGTKTILEPLLADLELAAVQTASDGMIETIEIDSARLSNTPLPLVRELLVRVWKQQHWPARDMRFDDWNQLAHAVSPANDCSATGSDCFAPRVFPGNIRACLANGRLVLRREHQ